MKTKSKRKNKVYFVVTVMLNTHFYDYYDVPYDSSEDEIGRICMEDVKEELDLFDKTIVKTSYDPSRMRFNVVSKDKY